MIPRCSICGTWHHEYQAHVFATNRDATNGAPSATNEREVADATKNVLPGPAGGGGPHDGREDRVGKEGAGRASGFTKNRRSREAYNAYQREYMKKRRASV